jgi:hypothetical protein
MSRKMNRKSYAAILALSFLALSFLTGCGSSSLPYKGPPPVVAIAATSGSGQSTTVGTAYTNSLVATVTMGGTPLPSALVTFTAPPSGASGTFASNSTATETVTTNASGVATSSAFTANTTAGADKVTASAAGASTAADFTLTNTSGPAVSSYSFYMSGQEAINNTSGINFYALAGAVTFDSFGNVVAGEQDYNDAIGLTSPEPAGDTITGGNLTVSTTTGQGTLTLTTNNAKLGVSGSETFGVQFVNTGHALIGQFDGTATSSGSMDMQTLPSTPSGNYAFTISGVSALYSQIAFGGVFSISGTSLSNGILDVNDAQSNVETGVAFTATTISAADAFGRGTIGGFSIDGFPIALNYYIVGPKVIRIIDVDTTDSSVGSAFSQGANAFTNASLGSSVFAVAGNPWTAGIDAVGQFSTNNTSSSPADFSGVGDDYEPVNGAASAPAFPIAGTYSVGANGYGSMTLKPFSLGDFNRLGIYMTDPTLNLNDPNNPAGGGGALVLDLDIVLSGASGVLIPQTDTTTAHFTGNYAVAAQGFTTFNSKCNLCEFDMVGQGSLNAGALSLTGLVSDPFVTLSAAKTSSADTFSSAPLADAINPGRYSMVSTNTTPNPLAATVNGVSLDFDVAVYQASGEQLFWINVINFNAANSSVFLGPVEQQGSLAGLPAASKRQQEARNGRRRPKGFD